MAELHAEARAFLERQQELGFRNYVEIGVSEARAQNERIAKDMAVEHPVRHVEDRLVPGGGGEVPARIYWPDADGVRPVAVAFHGGGWLMGSLESYDSYCRWLTRAVGCVTVSVNYRHSPEHRFPAAPEDCYAATRWVAGNAASLGADASRLAVIGSSAGGNLSAAVSLMARDRGGPLIAYQALIVPATDSGSVVKPATRGLDDGPGLTVRALRWFWDHYLASPADGANPYASPMRATTVAGLPPAIVVTVEHDPLREEGDAYAARLAAAGVPVEHRYYAGMLHAFRGTQSNRDLAAAMRRALGT